MSLSDTTDGNTVAEREYDGGGDFDANEEARIREEALDLAGTYYNDEVLLETLRDMCGNNERMDKALFDLFSSVLQGHDGVSFFTQEKTYRIGDLKNIIEEAAIERFRDQATKIVNRG